MGLFEGAESCRNYKADLRFPRCFPHGAGWSGVNCKAGAPSLKGQMQLRRDILDGGGNDANGEANDGGLALDAWAVGVRCFAGSAWGGASASVQQWVGADSTHGME
jgi:hypothetical protein